MTDQVEYSKGYYSAYQEANTTVDQVQQVVMLYDGAINFVKQAKDAIVEKNYEKRYNLINKAIAIVTGLNSCLNFTEETNETAKALDEFYSMIDMRLLYIQCDDSLESCDKVISSLKRMRDAWLDVAEATRRANFLNSQSSGEIVVDNVSQEMAVIDIKDSDHVLQSDMVMIEDDEIRIEV